MHKLKISIVCSFLALVVFGLTLQRHAIACEAIQFSGYEEVAPNIFASSSLENIGQVLESILKGKERIGSTFGPMIASPKIVLVTNTDEAAEFGANSTATAHYTPLGACIVLGPKGQNVDVAAHELVHAEVGYRVGWLTHWIEIPVWFNEGIALIVDHRPPFLVKNIELNQDEIEAVKQFNTGSEFFDGENTHKNYLASK